MLPEALEHGGEVGRERRLDHDGRAAQRMREADARHVQERPVEASALEEVPVRRRVALALVAEHRLADRGELAPERGCGAGGAGDLEQRVAGYDGKPSIARVSLDDFARGPLAARGLAGDDFAPVPLAVRGLAACGPEPAAAPRHAAYEHEALLFGAFCGECALERGPLLGRAREQTDTARAEVEATERHRLCAATQRAHARQQGLAVEVQSAPAERALPALRRAGVRFEAAVANPPRAGMAPRAREALAALVSGPIVLVSCEPLTLARDLAHFRELGFQVERLEPFDLMPLTDQIESITVLRKARPPGAQLLHDDPAFLAVNKPPGLPTLPLPEHADSLLARVRALRGRAQALALGRLELGASGVCLFATSPEHVPALERALAASGAEQQSLALVRGVARASGRLGAAAGKPPPAARYRRLEVFAGHALLEITIPASTPPPLRRLLTAIGEPVLGDERQGHAPSNRHLFERAGLDRAFLHASRLCFAHPLTGAAVVIEAPLAPDLAVVLERLGTPR